MIRWIIRGAMVALGIAAYTLAAKVPMQKMITGMEPPAGS